MQLYCKINYAILRNCEWHLISWDFLNLRVTFPEHSFRKFFALLSLHKLGQVFNFINTSLISNPFFFCTFTFQTAQQCDAIPFKLDTFFSHDPLIVHGFFAISSFTFKDVNFYTFVFEGEFLEKKKKKCRCFRPPFYTMTAALGRGQPGLLRWNLNENCPRAVSIPQPSTESELIAACVAIQLYSVFFFPSKCLNVCLEYTLSVNVDAKDTSQMPHYYWRIRPRTI